MTLSEVRGLLGGSPWQGVMPGGCSGAFVLVPAPRSPHHFPELGVSGTACRGSVLTPMTLHSHAGFGVPDGILKIGDRVIL